MHALITFITLGVVEGLTEFIPISSTGHLILVRSWLGIGDTMGLAQDAVLELAAIGAILVYFSGDILRLIVGTWRAVLSWRMTEEARMVIALVIGTVPAVAIGLVFEDSITTTFRGPLMVAGGLVVGSLIMLGAEWVARIPASQDTRNFLLKIRSASARQPAAGLSTQESSPPSWLGSLWIGLFQALALFPGMSRSGMTISGGLLSGLKRADAARFGFLLSLPIMLGAGSLQFIKLVSTGALTTIGLPLLAGAVAAFLSGLAAINFLIRFLRTHSLIPFVIYRLLLAAVIISVTFFS